MSLFCQDLNDVCIDRHRFVSMFKALPPSAYILKGGCLRVWQQQECVSSQRTIIHRVLAPCPAGKSAGGDVRR